MTVALCGDLWIYPESFRSRGFLIWPVYVNFDLDESESGEYAKQAAMAFRDVAHCWWKKSTVTFIALWDFL